MRRFGICGSDLLIRCLFRVARKNSDRMGDQAMSWLLMRYNNPLCQ